MYLLYIVALFVVVTWSACNTFSRMPAIVTQAGSRAARQHANLLQLYLVSCGHEKQLSIASEHFGPLLTLDTRLVQALCAHLMKLSPSPSPSSSSSSTFGCRVTVAQECLFSAKYPLYECEHCLLQRRLARRSSRRWLQLPQSQSRCSICNRIFCCAGQWLGPRPWLWLDSG